MIRRGEALPLPFKFQSILQVIKMQLVGDGPLDVPFVQVLQRFFGASKAPPPTMLYDKQPDKLEFAQ